MRVFFFLKVPKGQASKKTHPADFFFGLRHRQEKFFSDWPRASKEKKSWTTSRPQPSFLIFF